MIRDKAPNKGQQSHQLARNCHAKIEYAPQKQPFEIIQPSIPAPPRSPPELILQPICAPQEALHEIIAPARRRTEQSPKFHDSSLIKISALGDSMNSCLPGFKYHPIQKRAGDIESHPPSVIQSIVDTASQWEPIPNQFPLWLLGTSLQQTHCFALQSTDRKSK